MADLSRREIAVVSLIGAPAFVGVSILMLKMIDAADAAGASGGPLGWVFMTAFGYFWWRVYRDSHRT